MADQPDKALFIRPGGYDIYNLVTQSVEFSASYTSFQELRVDFNNDLIMTVDDNVFKIIEMYTGAVLKSIIHNYDSGNYHETYLHGHTLFNGAGSWMTFQEK